MTISTPVPDTYDAHIGARIRKRRKYRAMSLGALAEHAGVTYGQMARYENGTNRVTASTLVKLAIAMEVPVAWFFDGIEGLKT